MTKIVKKIFDDVSTNVVGVLSDLELDWSQIDKDILYVMQSATLIAGVTHNPIKYDEQSGVILGLYEPNELEALPGYRIVKIGYAPVAGLETMLCPPVVVFKRPDTIAAADGTDFEVQGSPS